MNALPPIGTKVLIAGATHPDDTWTVTVVIGDHVHATRDCDGMRSHFDRPDVHPATKEN